jgi:hypothetical protein
MTASPHILPFAPAAPTPAERERLLRAAIERANELRDESIHEFWRAAEHRLADAADQAGRAARRLAARLRQHAKQHGQVAPVSRR